MPDFPPDYTDRLDILRRYQAWRRGHDERPLPDTGLENAAIGLAIDAGIDALESPAIDKDVELGMAGVAAMFHDLKNKTDKMATLLFDCIDQLQSMAPACGCERAACRMCRDWYYIQELAHRYKQLIDFFDWPRMAAGLIMNPTKQGKP